MGWFLTDQGKLFPYFVWLYKRDTKELFYRFMLYCNGSYQPQILPKPANSVGKLRPIKNPYNAGGTW